MLVSGFVSIPFSVLISTLFTIFGLALLAISWILSYMMVQGLVNGAISVGCAIFGCS